MTNFESTSYHVEDQAGESVAFTVLPPTADQAAAGTGEHDPVLRLWSTQVMPDNRLINVEVGFSVGDVAGLQSFLNDQFGRGKVTRLPETAEEMVKAALINLLAYGYRIVSPSGAEMGPDNVPFLSGPNPAAPIVHESGEPYAADPQSLQDSSPATLDYYEPVPMLGVPAQPDYTPGPEAYAAQPQRQCPVISNGVQCNRPEGHGNTDGLTHYFPGQGLQQAGHPMTGDGAAPPPATPSATPVGAGGEQAAESATGVHNTEVAPSSAPAEKKRTRRTKLEMAYDRAKEAHNDAPSDETWAAFGAAQKALADKDPGNSRLAESISGFQNPEARPTAEEAARLPLQPTVQFAGEPVNPFTQPPPEQPQGGTGYIEQAQHPANQQFVEWANNLPGQHLQDSVVMTTEEAQAATGFPCPQMDSSGTRQCVRPYGHELMTATNPEPKPHVFASDPGALGQPIQPAPTPMQPQQPAFSVTTPALTGMTDGGAQILSFQTPPMPADPTAFQVQGANLQPPAPAAPFLQPVPNGGQ